MLSLTLSFIYFLLFTEAASLRGVEDEVRSRTLDTTRPVAEWALSEDGVAHLEIIVDNLICNTEGHYDESMIDQYRTYLMSAISDWGKSDVLDIGVARMAANECSNEAISFEGFINVVHDNTPWHQWIGLTTWEVDADNHVTSALVRFNDYFLFNPTREQYTSNAESRQMAVCHEIGHSVGLPHQDEVEGNVNSGTCMDYTTHPEGGDGFGPSDLHPNQMDFITLDQAYSHQRARQHKQRALENTAAKNLAEMKRASSAVDHTKDAQLNFGKLMHERVSKGMIRRHYEQYNHLTGGKTITFTVEHGEM
jgi:hypothetical protein